MDLPPLGTELPFVEARWFREVRKPNAGDFWIVLHDTEGHEHHESAEDGAAFDARRDDQTSTNRMCDRDTTVQCVRDQFIAFAHSPVNDWGKSLEICGLVTRSPDSWRTPPGRLEQVAWNVADWWQQKLDAGIDPGPLRFLYAEDLAANMRQHGVTTHNEISRACNLDGQVKEWMHTTGQTPSDHTDPGPNFYPAFEDRSTIADTPLGDVLRLAEQLLGTGSRRTIPRGDDDMATTLFKCIDPTTNQAWADAVFAGPLDVHGIAQWVEWIDPATVSTYEALGAKVIQRSKADGFKTIALLGPLPTGDKLFSWAADQFRRMI